MGMPGCNTLERGVETAIVPAGPALAKFIGNCYGVNLFRYWHNPFFCGGLKKASSLFCVGRLNLGCYLHINSVTEPPPGHPSGAAACIPCGGMGADSLHNMCPVHQSYPHQIAKSQKKGCGGEMPSRTKKGRENEYRRLIVIEAGLDVLAQPADCI